MRLIDREDHARLEMQFRPLLRKAGDLLTETQNRAFELGYYAGMDALVTFLQEQGVQMPEAVRGLRASAFVQVIQILDNNKEPL